jgi:hypothetical protein
MQTDEQTRTEVAPLTHPDFCNPEIDGIKLFYVTSPGRRRRHASVAESVSNFRGGHVVSSTQLQTFRLE